MFLAFPSRVREHIAFEGYGSAGEEAQCGIRRDPRRKTMCVLDIEGIWELRMSDREFQALARAVHEHERRS